MKVKKYRPAFFTGFEEETYEVNSKEELMECKLIKDWSRDGEICFSYTEDSTSCIMAVIERPDTMDGCEWWVVSVINNIDDAKTIRGWLPDWKDIIERYKKKP